MRRGRRASLEAHCLEALLAVFRHTACRCPVSRPTELRTAQVGPVTSLSALQERRQRQVLQCPRRPLLPRPWRAGRERSALVLDRQPCRLRPTRRLTSRCSGQSASAASRRLPSWRVSAATASHLGSFASTLSLRWLGKFAFALTAMGVFDPEAGSVIRGSGGVRKVRWAREGTGKSDGVRIVASL